MSDTKSAALAAAEAALRDLEAPKHRLTHARHDLISLKATPSPSSPGMKKVRDDGIAVGEQELVEAEEAYRAHETAHLDDQGDLHRKIEIASQAVLDARGEAHTDQAFVGGPDHAE